jgi:hypothetical protein
MIASQYHGFRNRNNHARVTGAALALCLIAQPVSAQMSAGNPGDDQAIGRPATYQLIDLTTGTLLRSSRPVGPLRLEATAALSPRHELRFSTWTVGRGGLDSMPGVSLATLTSDPALRLDPARATYRYTVLTQRDWAWKLGVSANVRELSDSLRPALLSDRFRFGALPLLHVAGEGRLAQRWGVAFDADGLMTARGHTLDLGLRVNYSLTPNFQLFGGYRLTEAAGNAEEFYGTGLSNAANFGLRYRF